VQPEKENKYQDCFCALFICFFIPGYFLNFFLLIGFHWLLFSLGILLILHYVADICFQWWTLRDYIHRELEVSQYLGMPFTFIFIWSLWGQM